MECSDEKESDPISLNRGIQRGTLICADCRTSKTPLWRGGPSGPKSLCNACGIRYRKRRRELLGLKDGAGKEKGKTRDNATSSSSTTTTTTTTTTTNTTSNKMGVLSLLGFGRASLLKQRSLLRLKRRRRLAEEEEAAVLLMALSSGLINA